MQGDNLRNSGLSASPFCEAAFGVHPSLPPPAPAGGQELRMDVVETASAGQPRHDASGGPHCDQVGAATVVREKTRLFFDV